jgi:hypothetical protein
LALTGITLRRVGVAGIGSLRVCLAGAGLGQTMPDGSALTAVSSAVLCYAK